MKMVNEYHSNQRKLKCFYLEERAARAALLQSSSSATIQTPIEREPLGLAAVVKLVKSNEKQQATSKSQTNSRAETFAQKSKEAALKQGQRQATKTEKKRKLFYSRFSENRSFL